MTDISVIILQKNEALHIKRCLEKLALLEPKEIFVVDCFSTDGSDKIAESMGAKVVQHAWPGLYAPQYNWAAENCPIKSEWVLRLDADEYLLPETIEEIKEKLPKLPADVTGIIFKRRHVVWGKWMKRGMYPVKLLRLYRQGKGICEERYMDEHILLKEGCAVEFEGDFVDENLNSFEWWKDKHRGYAKREAKDAHEILERLRKKDFSELKGVDGIGAQAAAKRAKKYRYYSLPPYLRVIMYFCIRFFLKGAILEGPKAWKWCWYHAMWYRWMVDREIGRMKNARD